MRIRGFDIGVQPFLIAEVGLNHNGSVERALEMIRVAASCGVDACKFQTFKADGVCDDEEVYEYWSEGKEVREKRIDIFRRCELPEDAWPKLKAECEANGLLFMSTPQNPSDLDLLLKVGIPAIKIGSDDLTNLEMLRYCARDDVGLPIILSTGMSTAHDIDRAVQILKYTNFALLVCTSQYPCPIGETHLARIDALRRALPTTPIGFSDHTIGEQAAIAATALGACIFEKHFTLDHGLPGPDHWFAADPYQLYKWAEAIRTTQEMLGSDSFILSERESAQKAKYQRTATR